MSGGAYFFTTSRYWLALIIGISFSGWLRHNNWLAIGLGLVISSLVLITIKTKQQFWSVVLLLFCGLLGYWRAVTVWSGLEINQQRLICPQSISLVRGQIASHPQQRSNGGWQVIIKQVDYCCQGNWFSWPGRLLITGRETWSQQFQLGQVWQFNGHLNRWPDSQIFGYGYYLANQGVQATWSTTESQLVSQRLEQWWFKLVDYQQRLIKTIDNSLPEPAASLANSLIWGSRGRLDSKLAKQLSITGLSHVVAVSGFHISLLIVLLINSLTRFGSSRRGALIITSLIIIAYLGLIGVPASAVRASLLSFLTIGGQQLGRTSRQGHLLLVVAGLMLLINPFYLWGDLGFILSFSAVFGLLFWTKPWQKWLDQYRLFRQPWIKNSLATTLAAQMWAGPIIFWQFGQISLIAPLANLIVVSFLPWLIIFLLIASPIIYYYPVGGPFILVVANYFLKVLLIIIDWLASWPLAGWSVDWSLSWRLFIVLVYSFLTLVWLVKNSYQ